MEPNLLDMLPWQTTVADQGSAAWPTGSFGVAEGTGAGQHGIRPSGGGFSVGNIFSSTWAWVNRPFQSPMAPIDVVLLIGVIIIGFAIWGMILYHIRIASEAL